MVDLIVRKDPIDRGRGAYPSIIPQMATLGRWNLLKLLLLLLLLLGAGRLFSLT